MCGRFSFAIAKEKITKTYPKIKIPESFQVSYNIAPTQNAMIITNENPEILQSIRWGLIPNWSKSNASNGNLINARAEGIELKPSFSLPIRQKRCLVLADSFYEWKKVGKNKIPHRIVPKNDQILAFAGIWDVWRNEKQEEVTTFSIITVPPNEEVSGIHNRMPATLVSIDAQMQWLESNDLATALSLLKPTPDDFFTIYSVSEKANSPAYNNATIHTKQNPPLTLFDNFL